MRRGYGTIFALALVLPAWALLFAACGSGPSDEALARNQPPPTTTTRGAVVAAFMPLDSVETVAAAPNIFRNFRLSKLFIFVSPKSNQWQLFSSTIAISRLLTRTVAMSKGNWKALTTGNRYNRGPAGP